ncbi:MAG TPA: hypothetical protein DDZ96_10695 [Porphyromonadaceae bacterium]|jgi:hypothetical protein|nr:hypothetical protein [Porphyromonadaceae bacterium]HBX19940.1 hypothetical protein [Porphyromonadaceae bacterium]HCM21679.1 hypothetical protein [Porphyromonadaceae bacterium]
MGDGIILIKAVWIIHSFRDFMYIAGKSDNGLLNNINKSGRNAFIWSVTGSAFYSLNHNRNNNQ